MAEPIEAFMQKLIAMSKINNDYAALLRVVEEEEQRRGDEHMIHVLKGWVLTNLGQYDRASRSFEQALILNPESAWAYFRKGEMLAAQDRFKEAVECFSNAVRLKPNRPDFWVEKGLAEDATNNLSGAYESFEKAVQRGDKTGWGFAGKARILAYLNRYEDALETVRNALKLNPDEEGFKKLEREIIDKLSGY